MTVDSSKRNWLFFSRTSLQSLHIALQPSVSGTRLTHQSLLMQLLDEVDKAYGQRATAFRNTTQEAWAAAVRDAGLRWPKEGTGLRKVMDGIFHKLCSSLRATQQSARAHSWSEEKLQGQLTDELVRLVVTSSFSTVQSSHFLLCSPMRRQSSQLWPRCWQK